MWKQYRPAKKANLVILIDSCFSGCWCYRLYDINDPSLNISIYASCERKEKAEDIEGGLLIKCICGSEEQFENNYVDLSHFQNPVYLKNGSDKVDSLDKSLLYELQKDISNALTKGTRQRNGKGVMKYSNQDKYKG